MNTLPHQAIQDNAVDKDLLFEYAERYIRDCGFSLCLIRPASKAPALFAWNAPERALDTVEKAHAALKASPGHGTGLLHGASHTASNDVDHVAWTRLVFTEFGLDYEGLFGSFPRIRSRDGKDKIIFRMPEDFAGPSKIKLNWPDDSGECDARGNPKLVTVFELRGGVNQDVLPPSIHPDTQQPYTWIKAPWEFTAGIPQCPPELLAIWREWDTTFRRQFEAACPWAKTSQQPDLPPIQRHHAQEHGDVIGKFNQAHRCEDLLTKYGYRRKGKRWLAPNSSTNIPGVVILGDRVYSHHASDELNNGHAHDAFSLYVTLEHHGDIREAVRLAAESLGITADRSSPADISAFLNSLKRELPPAEPITAEEIVGEEDSQGDPPEKAEDEPVFRLPGILGVVQDWIDSTARKPQPMFSIQAALAFGSVVLGRQYVTSQRNWSSLYFLNIGKSASGKEHAKWAIEKLLAECQLPHLIGPSFYTSDSGLLSALHSRPCHITIIDEFGKILEGAAVRNNARSASAMRALMEVWGRCDNVIRPLGYSTFGMTDSDAKKLEERSVYNPALTVLGLTTPESLYNVITSAAARDGFLNRFLIVESSQGRQVGRYVPEMPVPGVVTAWASQVQIPMQANGVVKNDTNATLWAQPKVMTFTPAAIKRFHESEATCINLMDQHDNDGLGEMFGRTNEMAMRIALILALATLSPVIESEHAEWAINYTHHHGTRIAKKLRTAVADSEFEGLQNHVFELISKHAKGMTVSELTKASRRYRGLTVRQRTDVLTALVNAERLEHKSYPPPHGRGKPREAWVVNNGDNGDKT